MEPTFPINYRAGWIEPVDEYIPEIMEPKPDCRVLTDPRTLTPSVTYILKASVIYA